jgi:Flp pilus assembly protein TadG
MGNGFFDTKLGSAGTGCRNSLGGTSKFRSSPGQVIVEFALVLPLLILLALGVIDISFLLHDQHIVIRLSREGSNLISRNVTLGAAATTMSTMVNPPVNLNGSNSKMIFTVLTNYSGSGQNNSRVIVYQRWAIGGLAASSVFQGSLPQTSFGPAPDYIAANPGGNTNLRVNNVPTSLVINPGQFVYVTEIFTRHALLTPLGNFGVSLPSTLYSVAYF